MWLGVTRAAATRAGPRQSAAGCGAPVLRSLLRPRGLSRCDLLLRVGPERDKLVEFDVPARISRMHSHRSSPSRAPQQTLLCRTCT